MFGRALSAKAQKIDRCEKACEAGACNHQERIILKDAHDQIRNRERGCCEQGEQAALIACLGRFGRCHNDLVSHPYRINSSLSYNIRLNIYE